MDIDTTSGTKSAGQATINGSVQGQEICIGIPEVQMAEGVRASPQILPPPPKCSFVWDSGTVRFTIAGDFTVSTTYGKGDTSSTVAARLVAQLAPGTGSPVKATLSGSTITMTSIATGLPANYSLSSPPTGNDFGVVFSGATMTGGQYGPPPPNGLNQQYTLDAWGDLSQMGGTSGFSQPINMQNQISTFQYDAAGRLINDSGMQYTYNDDNMLLTSSDGEGYSYDAEDQRVSVSGRNGRAEYFYFAGHLMAIQNPSLGTWLDMIYAGGQRIAEVVGNLTATPVYALTDQLGSNVETVDNNGAVISSPNLAPFGEYLYGTSSDGFVFAGLQKDASGLHHAMMRQYSSTTGRWITPDPFDGSYSLSDPQSFNRYR